MAVSVAIMPTKPRTRLVNAPPGGFQASPVALGQRFGIR